MTKNTITYNQIEGCYSYVDTVYNDEEKLTLYQDSTFEYSNQTGLLFGKTKGIYKIHNNRLLLNTVPLDYVYNKNYIMEIKKTANCKESIEWTLKYDNEDIDIIIPIAIFLNKNGQEVYRTQSNPIKIPLDINIKFVKLHQTISTKEAIIEFVPENAVIHLIGSDDLNPFFKNELLKIYYQEKRIKIKKNKRLLFRCQTKEN